MPPYKIGFHVCAQFRYVVTRAKIEEKTYYKLSRCEICVANFIPPANGASLGSYLVKNCNRKTDRQTV